MHEAEQKEQQLQAMLADLQSVVVAYSGGCDSAYLMSVAHTTLESHALAATAVSPSLARSELKAACSLARDRGWAHITVPTKEVAREEYARNYKDRCYWCKSELFEVLEPIATQRGARICSGTNFDDLSDYRPGLRAANEHGVSAPLAEVGLTKEEIRWLSRRLDLPTADKPASPCLSSRFAYGVRVTPAALRRVERAEEIMHALGFEIVRVRDHDRHAVIEVGEGELERAFEQEDAIRKDLTKLGYEHVEVDPLGYRTGSLNRVVLQPKIVSSSG